MEETRTDRMFPISVQEDGKRSAGPELRSFPLGREVEVRGRLIGYAVDNELMQRVGASPAPLSGVVIPAWRESVGITERNRIAATRQNDKQNGKLV